MKRTSLSNENADVRTTALTLSAVGMTMTKGDRAAVPVAS